MKLINLLLILMSLAIASCGPKAKPQAVAGPVSISNAFSVSVANQYYVQSQNIDIVLTHPAVITVTGVPKLSLDIGGSIVDALYVSGSGSTSLIFRYTVVMNDLDTDGIEINPTLDLNAGTLKYTENSVEIDANTSLTLPNLTGVQVDAITPTISAVNLSAAKTYYLNEDLDFTVQFSENVIITGAPKLTLDIGGTVVDAMYQSGSGTNSIIFRRTVELTDVDLNGPSLASPLVLNSGTIRDIAGNNANLAFLPPDASSVIINGAAPIITSIDKPANGTYLLGQDLEFFVNFNKNVNVTGTPTIALDIGGTLVALSYVSGSGSSQLLFSYTIQAGEQDTNGIEIAQIILLNGGTIRDVANNDARLTFGIVPLAGVFVHAIQPYITNISAPANAMYSTTQNLSFVATFSEAVNIVGTPRIAITLNSGTVYANYLEGSGTTNITFRYTVGGSDLDNDGIALVTPLELNSGTIKSTYNIDALLPFTAPNTSGITINNVAPYILSITPPANGNYVDNNNIDFNLAWSESINVSGSPRLVLNVGGVTKYASYQAGLSNATTSVFRYTVLNGDSDHDGIGITASVDLNGGTIQNVGLVNATLTFIAPNLAAVVVNSSAPTITSVTAPANAIYTETQNMDFVVNFSESVTVTGSRLAIVIGATTRYATYLSGSPSANITYRYTVVSGDNDSDGIAITSPLDLNGGSIVSGGSQNAILTFTPPNTTGVLVDTTIPTITSVTPPANGSYKQNDQLVFTVNFSESVTISGGTSYISLNVGGNARQAICPAGTGVSAACSYTVQAGENDSDGIEHSSPLVLAGSTIQDVAGNNLVLTFTPASTTGVLVDAVGPTVVAVTKPTNGTYLLNDNIAYVVQYSKAVTVASGTPRITLDVGGITRYANLSGGSGSAYLTFTYIVLAGDEDLNGITNNINIDLNGATIRDVASNNAELLIGAQDTSGVLVDANPPTIALTTPAKNSYINIATNTTTFSVSGTCSENARTVTIKVNGIDATGPVGLSCNGTNFSGTIDVTGLTEAAHSFTATISDVAGNSTVSTAHRVTKDTTAPTISSVTMPANQNYNTRASLDFTVVMSEAANVTGSPRITINIDTGGPVYATYASGSGSTNLVFTYTVAAGQTDATGGIVLVSPVDLNGGSVADLAGNNATLTYTPAANKIKINFFNPLGSSVVWLDAGLTVITAYNFRQPGANRTDQFYLRNDGDTTTVPLRTTIMFDTQNFEFATNNCVNVELAPNETCAIQIRWKQTNTTNQNKSGAASAQDGQQSASLLTLSGRT